MTAMPPEDWDNFLGSGKVPGRFDQPKPLPWYCDQVKLMWAFVVAIALIVGAGAVFG